MTKHTGDEIIQYLQSLREEIISQFESFEDKNHFERKRWKHHSGGGGEIAVLRGKEFEKAAVNWSAVSGEQFPSPEINGSFFATGVSLITHMSNPHAPTVHMNLRYIETEDNAWFAGGYDLTPMGFPYLDDTTYFHGIAQKSLDPFGSELYPEYAKNARDYFYIPHWKKERGVGGIFFDQMNTGDFERDFALWKNIGEHFLEAILPIYQQRTVQPYTALEKEKQLEMRAHYVEFNLLYDRGTKFGFQSGGNPEAILCSMPPVAKW